MILLIAALTGLDPNLVRRLEGRITIAAFLRELAPGRLASVYDGTLTDPDAVPSNPYFGEPEPTLNRLTAPFTEAMLELYRHHLNWTPPGLYRLQNLDAARQWDWGQRPPPQSMIALREALAVDPHLRVLVAHGLFDLRTPYFATKQMLDSLPPSLGGPDRIRFVAFEGGHMFYSRDGSRAALREEARKLIVPE